GPPGVEVDGGAGGGVNPLVATSAGTEGLGEDLAGLVQVAQQAAFEDGAQGGQDLGVAQDVGRHGLGLALPAIQLTQAQAQPRPRVGDGAPGGQGGGRVQGPPVGRAGGQQRRVVGEVVVDGHALHAGAPGDLVEVGGCRTDGAGQPHGAL